MVVAGRYEDWNRVTEAALRGQVEVLVAEFLALTPETVMEIFTFGEPIRNMLREQPSGTE